MIISLVLQHYFRAYEDTWMSQSDQIYPDNGGWRNKNGGERERERVGRTGTVGKQEVTILLIVYTL